MFALAEAEDMLCPDCGQPREVCADPDRPWYPQRHVCFATKDREAWNRRWRKKHEKAKPDGAGRLPTDGEWLWVSQHDLSPEDDFL